MRTGGGLQFSGDGNAGPKPPRPIYSMREPFFVEDSVDDRTAAASEPGVHPLQDIRAPRPETREFLGRHRSELL